MSKYGSGVSMKTMLKLEMEEIDAILNKSNLSKEDREVIQDAYKEVAYQWCHTNAIFCAYEETLKQAVNEETMQEFTKDFVPMSFGFVTQKMKETFPWYGGEDD